MLTAQTLNEKQMPIYGSYISGRNWFFAVLLNDRSYCFSDSYVSTNKDDLLDIFRILRNMRQIIERQLTIT